MAKRVLKKKATSAGQKVSLKTVDTPLMKDKQGVDVSVLGDDRGTKERLTPDHGVIFDPEGKVDDRLGGLGEHHTVINGRISRVSKSQDALDIMLRNKTIGEDEYHAGRKFQVVFDWVNQSNLSSLKLDHVPGNSDKAHFMDQKLLARKILDSYREAMGGDRNWGYVSVYCIVGYGMTLSQMTGEYGKPANFYSGCVVSSLQMLATYLKKGKTV